MTRKIGLERISYSNFKGLRTFTLEANGDTISVFGDNAAGKTTLFDGFTWLLFDKDSQNKKDFDIKTLDVSGKVLKGLEHAVEAILLIEGRRKTLRKVFAEKWTKKRGSATEEFTGHTTDYLIDGVPMKKSEYDDFVDSIMKESLFKLLTSPTFFNEQLKWQERRKILLEVCGDVSDAEVIAGNKDLAALPEILGERSLDDHRKVIAARRSELNKSLDMIPIRIDEVERSKADTDGLDAAMIEAELASLSAKIVLKEGEMARIQSGGEVAVKELRQREIEGELLDIKNTVQSGTMDKVSAKHQELDQLRTQAGDTDTEVKRLQRELQSNEAAIQDRKTEMERLRNQWTEVNAETLANHQHIEDCPACGQKLPADRIADALEKATAEFNRNKSERLETISAKGKTAAVEVKRLEQESADLNKKLEDFKSQYATVLEKGRASKAELEQLQAGMVDVDADPTYVAKQNELDSVKQDILGLRSSAQGDVDKVRLELSKLRTEVEHQEQNKAKLSGVQAGAERIAALKREEKQLASEYETLEQQLYLTEEFIRTKVQLLESKINSKFKFARFKLFDQQINGGLSEVCETMYGGVTYSGGLNNAARINVGLDIINTLAEHYGVEAPIFIDNSEAVTQLMETSGQQVRLFVSKPDKQLRVVTKNMVEAV